MRIHSKSKSGGSKSHGNGKGLKPGTQRAKDKGGQTGRSPVPQYKGHK